MDVMRAAGIAIVVACVVLLVYSEVQKRLVFARYEKLFSRGDFEGCLRVLDRPVTRLVFPRYNRLYMRLNALICLDDAKGARGVIDEMLGLRASAEQRSALLVRGFNFFVEQRDYPRAAELLEELRGVGPEEAVADCQRTYDIYARKSSAYVEEMEAELEHATGSARTTLLYLLSLQYENRGDRRRAKRCLEQVREAFDAFAAAGAGPEGATGEDEG